jgi:uncharacterized protein YxeA
MKTTFTLVIFLLICQLTFAQTGSLFKLNNALSEDMLTQSEATLKSKNISSDLGVINIADFEEYITNNGGQFEQLLFTFNVKNKNKMYFTVRAANRKTGELATVAFSSLNKKMDINLTDKQSFNDIKDESFNPKGFFLEKSDVMSMLKEIGADTKKLKLKAVHTKDSTQQSFMNLLFQGKGVADTSPTFSTFNVEAGRMAPETGCPPFNCMD